MSFFEYLRPFCFCQLNLIILFLFLIKYYHILFIIIVFWFGCDRPSGLLFLRAHFAYFHTHASLLAFFVCFFILFHSCCSYARVFGKTLLHEFPVSYSHTEWYLLFRSVKAMNNLKLSAIKQILLLLLIMFSIRGGWMICNFLIIEVHFVFVNLISLYFFHLLQNTNK